MQIKVFALCLIMSAGCTVTKNTSQELPAGLENQEQYGNTISKHPENVYEPGKCFAKCAGHHEWVEIVCDHNVTKKLIIQICSDLVRLGYYIEKEEIEKGVFGPTTKQALHTFQEDYKLPVGSINLITLNKLKELRKE